MKPYISPKSRYTVFVYLISLDRFSLTEMPGVHINMSVIYRQKINIMLLDLIFAFICYFQMFNVNFKWYKQAFFIQLDLRI